MATITVTLDDTDATPAERIADYCASIGRPLTAWQIRWLERQAR